MMRPATFAAALCALALGVPRTGFCEHAGSVVYNVAPWSGSVASGTQINVWARNQLTGAMEALPLRNTQWGWQVVNAGSGAYELIRSGFARAWNGGGAASPSRGRVREDAQDQRNFLGYIRGLRTYFGVPPAHGTPGSTVQVLNNNRLWTVIAGIQNGVYVWNWYRQ